MHVLRRRFLFYTQYQFISLRATIFWFPPICRVNFLSVVMQTHVLHVFHIKSFWPIQEAQFLFLPRKAFILKNVQCWVLNTIKTDQNKQTGEYEQFKFKREKFTVNECCRNVNYIRDQPLFVWPECYYLSYKLLFDNLRHAIMIYIQWEIYSTA